MSAKVPIRVLIADDDETFRNALARALSRRGHHVIAAATPEDALLRFEEAAPEAALLDLRMPGMDGIHLLQELRRRAPELPVVILTGHGTIPSAIEAIQAGAYHYLTKPCEVDEIEVTIRNAARQHTLVRENSQLRSALERATGYAGIIGTSPAIRAVIDLIERTKESLSPVLIQGESGTGKELVARALHSGSSRRHRPFVTLSCAGLKPESLESELFGHTEGAFAGALRAKEGLLEVADGGSLLVDEIADMDLAVQASLLRVVETGVFRPLGATREKRVQVRFIAATNRPLREEVSAGRFRQDLLYRLDVVHIELPPLRARRPDIPLLARDYLARSREATSKKITLSDEAMAVLDGYAWPGNVRELHHVLERAILLSAGGPLRAADVAAVLHPGRSGPAGPPITLEDSERNHIAAMLEQEGGNVSRVSELLGIDRRTLQRKMKRYGLRGE
jgi:two-component system response regulator AtoC